MKNSVRFAHGRAQSHLRPLLAVAIALTVLASGLPGQAQARIPLQEDRQIDDGLTLVAIGNYLRRNCDEISPKYFKTLGFMRSLQDRARELGYSDEEIEAYLDDEAEKARVKARARAYLVARGVDFDREETFCTVGRAEIATGTSVGRFLNAN
jgi:hypothetical protein